VTLTEVQSVTRIWLSPSRPIIVSCGEGMAPVVVTEDVLESARTNRTLCICRV